MGTVFADSFERLSSGPVAVLSGAGISTASGIPDYRGESGRKRTGNPMTYREFTRSSDNQRHYWARSALGWPRIADVVPNTGHRALAELEDRGRVAGIITQNVDGLHQRAGSRRVIELHGSLEQVFCLTCGFRENRRQLQQRMERDNPGWISATAVLQADGDTDLDRNHTSGFRTPRCLQCEGELKPDVVFFGENVEKDRVAAAYRMVDESGALLVLGSSLTVRSGFRFAEHAVRQGFPVVIVNQGPTRADNLAVLKIDADVTLWLETWLASSIQSPVGGIPVRSVRHMYFPDTD